MNRISILKNPVQEYAWGSKSDIQLLIGKPEAIGRPMAELWMGGHPNAPSQVMISGKWLSLEKIVAANPEAILGKNTAKKFANRLPFLFKLLAAEKPLSVQVHPNLQQARKGFSRENALGIPLDAPNRNYRDDNHKPEILCALTPFQVLKGFRRIEEILYRMDRLSLSILSNELELLKKNPDSRGMKSFFSALMSMNKTRQEQVTQEAVQSAEGLAGEDVAYDWMVSLNREYPGDIGILSPVILNPVLLEPGEAVFLAAGELHVYLHGLGIELMANSDNVLRGGLTPKHIDPPELLKIVDFKTGPVYKIKPTQRDPARTLYETPAREFLLSVIVVSEENAFISPADRSVEIMICLSGKAEIEDLGTGEVLSVKRGQSLIVPSGISRYLIKGNAKLYVASVPL